MNIPTRVLIHGASGRMGLALLRLAAEFPLLQIAAAVSHSGEAIDTTLAPVIASANLSASPNFDIAVDFSLPAGFDALLALCRSRKAALVCGTTGLSDKQHASLKAAGNEIAVCWASNFSLGVTVLDELVRRAAHLLHDWEVEIVETHHIHKKDAPSGTALTLGQAIATERGATPPIASIRAGETIGEHTVQFLGSGERIELTHQALNRDIFARGALTAATALASRPAGNYPLADLVFPK